MKRYWSILMMGIYGLLIAFSFPFQVYLFDGLDSLDLTFYAEWGFWIFTAVIILLEASLFIPLKLPSFPDRPVGKRSIIISLISAALLMGIMTFMAIQSIIIAVFVDDGMIDTLYGIISILLAFWAFWAWMFVKNIPPQNNEWVIHRLMKWLIKGSIIELIVAVPSHIIVRNRDSCCAPAMTLGGILCGFTIMLIAFGPGIYFLYKKRIERKRSCRGKNHS